MISLKNIENDTHHKADDTNVIIEDKSDSDFFEHSSTTEHIDDTTDTFLERRKKIKILEMYPLMFSELKDYIDIDFSSLDDEMLDKLQQEFNFIISAKSVLNSAQQGFVHSLNILETVVPTLRGISMLANDECVQRDVKLIALNNMSTFHTKPEYRIVYKIISTALILHKVNSNPSIARSDEHVKTINDKFKDLDVK